MTSVFAIHGLGSNPQSAWTYKPRNENETEVLWLKDLLPVNRTQSIRVTLINHQTRWQSQVSTMDLEGHAGSVLRAIDDLNQACLKCSLTLIKADVQQGRRPIIFIAHSHGGIILKKVSDMPFGDLTID